MGFKMQIFVFIRSPEEMNYYAVKILQNIYVYIGHSFHQLAMIIIVLYL